MGTTTHSLHLLTMHYINLHTTEGTWWLKLKSTCFGFKPSLMDPCFPRKKKQCSNLRNSCKIPDTDTGDAVVPRSLWLCNLSSGILIPSPIWEREWTGGFGAATSRGWDKLRFNAVALARNAISASTMGFSPWSTILVTGSFLIGVTGSLTAIFGTDGVGRSKWMWALCWRRFLSCTSCRCVAQRVVRKGIYLKNQLLLISTNLTPETSHSCLKKMVH